MRLALVLLVSLIATPALADARTYQGTLGDRQIVVELTEPEDGAIVGRFAYMDDGADVPLYHVTDEDGLWMVQEEGPCVPGECVEGEEGMVLGGPIVANWTLNVDANRQILTGERELFGNEVTKAPLPISLSFVGSRKVDGVAPDVLHAYSLDLAIDPSLSLDDAPYERTLLDVNLEPGEISQSNGIDWSYVTDPRSGLTFPRLVAPSPELAALGAAMDDHFGRMTLSALECKAFVYAAYGVSEYSIGFGGGTAGYEGEEVQLSFLSPTLASWSQAGSLFCQGAHPYNHFDNYTLDARTGEALDWRQVFSALVPRQWSGAVDAIVDRDTALADPDSYHWGPDAELIAFVRERTPAELFEGDSEMLQFCFSDEAIANQLSMRVVEGADIMFTLSGFPHVASACNGDLFSASLPELEPFLAETAKDYFPE